MARSTGDAGYVLMILVDTNVLSAMMRVAVEPAVERWFELTTVGLSLDDDRYNLRDPFWCRRSGSGPSARPAL